MLIWILAGPLTPRCNLEQVWSPSESVSSSVTWQQYCMYHYPLFNPNENQHNCAAAGTVHSKLKGKSHLLGDGESAPGPQRHLQVQGDAAGRRIPLLRSQCHLVEILCHYSYFNPRVKAIKLWKPAVPLGTAFTGLYPDRQSTKTNRSITPFYN